MDRRTTGFVLALTVQVALATLPAPFAWSNRVEPEVLGLPFAMFWQFLLAVTINATLIAWYLLDARSGDLEIDIDAVDKRSVDCAAARGGAQQ